VREPRYLDLYVVYHVKILGVIDAEFIKSDGKVEEGVGCASQE